MFSTHAKFTAANDKLRVDVDPERKINTRVMMSKSNDKKAKASKSKPKATESAYKQAQGKPTATPMPFGKKFSAKTQSRETRVA